MKIAVWYHCKLSGAGIPDACAAREIMLEQVAALKASGLAAFAQEIHAGINGGPADASVVRKAFPDNATLHIHGLYARTELPTFSVLRRWLPSHPDWFVLYHHSKGVTLPNDETKKHHRLVMQKACVENWENCVCDLERGFDAVGINLVDPDTRPGGGAFGKVRFFAGNFWWARASYLLQLPRIPDRATEYSIRQRCIAEMWIGSCKQRPIMFDYERPELYAFWEKQGRVRK